MVASITPMISGSVSKTVNLPAATTQEDISDIYLLAYKTGVKAISVYRDCCKACQPLNLGSEKAKMKMIFPHTHTMNCLPSPKNSRKQVPERLRPSGMRNSRTHSAKIGDVELYVTLGFYNDGNIAEIFVSTDKKAPSLKGLLASLSKAISNMLSTISPPRRYPGCCAASSLNQRIRQQTSVYQERFFHCGLISRIIDIELGDYTRCHVKPKRILFRCSSPRSWLCRSRRTPSPICVRKRPNSTPKTLGKESTAKDALFARHPNFTETAHARYARNAGRQPDAVRRDD